MVLEVMYKLKILGMGLERTSLIVGDNMSVILNTNPFSMLKREENSVVYHRVRETIAFKIIHFYHLPSAANVADILTKPLSSEVIHGLLRQCLYRKPRVHGITQILLLL